MQAHPIFDFNKTVKEHHEYQKKQLRDFAKAMPRLSKLAPLIRTLSHFYVLHAYASNYCSAIELTVGSFKDVEPALQLIEDQFKVKFDGTSDIAWSTGGQREFRAKGLPFVLKASVRADAANCRVVEVGAELVKCYKVVCD